MCYLRGYWPINGNKSNNQKNYKIKKTFNNLGINQSNGSNDGQPGQLGQVLDRSTKKDFLLSCKVSQS